MIRNASLLLLATAIPALALTGCSKDDNKDTAAATTSTTAPTTVTNDGDDPGEPNGGTRIPLGQTKVVIAPADAVLDIKGLRDWTAADLTCTAVTESGTALELLPPPADAQPEEAAHGGTWMPLWTVGAAPGPVTIGCKAVDNRIPNADTSFVRVVPRGLMLGQP
ncbi:hypothetical protein JK358_06365 [Nocardia sp. 2]|uniref:MmpS family membrane protein n=1 Tax=Nocardia acididurans TaxID=2802282 RepID=A0ABS1M1D0_9NOCA|nr:hypothetical protein [Nocardia acididurans]MBL1074014.1 hypothetical protein [Nocardia acididurans]